jgi:hypothetical protein
MARTMIAFCKGQVPGIQSLARIPWGSCLRNEGTVVHVAVVPET